MLQVEIMLQVERVNYDHYTNRYLIANNILIS
jgi:hypothetical protein